MATASRGRVNLDLVEGCWDSTSAGISAIALLTSRRQDPVAGLATVDFDEPG